MKPAFEPVVVARKPLSGTLAQTVLAYGTGTLNIDASRIGTTDDRSRPPTKGIFRFHGFSTLAELETAAAVGGKCPDGRDAAATLARYRESVGNESHEGGRWPANVVLDASQAAALDQQSGVTRDGVAGGNRGFQRGGYVGGTAPDSGLPAVGYGGEGGASRFFKTVDDVTPRFMYTAKAGSDERPNVDGVAHPTVKSLDLMRWLVKLVTPKGGTVLEPFAGSGTTVEAAVLEGFRCIAIEREADYLPLIMQRVSKPHAVGLDFGDWEDAS